MHLTPSRRSQVRIGRRRPRCWRCCKASRQARTRCRQTGCSRSSAG
ncbi:hypothetical protein BU14_0178s0019 [Porphyra umbilicalis]|uniref:Uncharacterized protein n=1 Tax=Porphyra umbilicalis TaxID=2786 RepID=A0A1X6P7V4_PORUM|nr:hypothetical protein BU14_0178s0019 [Porphyra umbilicalis]|eukprot:OSX76703.1 hypothetical protein BU14_0178s0019 [Porphyra umbilicalis]